MKSFNPTTYTVFTDFVAKPLPRVNELYLEVYRYTGEGRLHTLTVDFNHDEVLIEVEIDGIIMFTINCDELEAHSTETSDIGPLIWKPSDDKIIFKPSHSVEFDSTLVIRSKASGNSSNRALHAIIIEMEQGI